MFNQPEDKLKSGESQRGKVALKLLVSEVCRNRSLEIFNSEICVSSGILGGLKKRFYLRKLLDTPLAGDISYALR